MLVEYEKLAKILHHELQTGCKDKAVINGLESFVAIWQKESLERAVGEEERAQVEQIVQRLSGYAGLDISERTVRLSELLRTLNKSARPTPSPKAEPVAAPAFAPAVAQSQATSAPKSPRSASAASSGRGVERSRHVDLSKPVTALRGVQEATAKKLKQVGVETIEDLIHFYPRRHVDYSALKTIDQLFYSEEVTVIGTIAQIKIRETRRGITLTDVVISDDTGAIAVTWFNNPYIVKRLKEGHQISISGKVDEYLGKLVFTSPEWELVDRELLNTGRLVPMYRLTAGLYPRSLRKLVKQTLETYLPYLQDHLPTYVRQRTRLLELASALSQIHFPDNQQMLERARRRLAFDEFLLVQLSVLRQRQRWQSQPAAPLPTNADALDAFFASLPFQLTQAQKQAIEEIKQDMAKPVAMSRLLQGDVGSGKTVVAAAAAQIALSNGKQSAIMAPTEILAEQHYRTFIRLFANTPVAIRLLIGSTGKKDKEAIKEEIASGAVNIVVGTHALIQEDVAFSDLGLVVVDEQHRFGVEQRSSLRQKGFNPHMLVMTATPIPRTLSLTLYGDLDLSILDELPPGRQPIFTQRRDPLERERTYAFVRKQAREGRQAFIICPLVEESDKLEAKAAIAEHERLQRDIFPDLKLGLLHGRMKGKEKDEVMRAFLNRDYDVLVSTSVVEVGIDVPNATVMLIEGANRFGLSQLHQFRGRVGRGEHASYCFLLTDSASDQGAQRLEIIEQTMDGFRLAEEDLKMRGPGEFFGTRQSGLPDLKVANFGDVRVLEEARRETQDIFAHDPRLQQPEHQLLAQRLHKFWRGEGDLS